MKTFCCVVLLCLFLEVAVCVRKLKEKEDMKDFQKYMRQFDKIYAANDMPMRFAAFKANQEKIKQLNAAAAKKGANTKFGWTKFSDLTAEEFQKYYLGYKPHHSSEKQPTQWDSVNVALPDSWDWTTKGAVTPVKDQGQCGSCWAFSATEGVESGWFLCGHTLPVLAPQQIVDCDTSDSGCNGGDLPTAFGYVEANGQEPESDYPYTAEDGTCQYNQQDVVAKITGFKYATQSQNETAMQVAMMSSGPLSICVDASDWQNYNGGVIESCGDSLDHCVQAVGWATYSDGTPYWNVRNSWGTSWGQNGFVWVERNQNMCGIAEEATYVTC